MADNTRMRDMQQRLEALEQQFHAAELICEQQHMDLQESQLICEQQHMDLQESQTQLHESQQQIQESQNRFHQDLNRLIELQQNNRGILGTGPNTNHNTGGKNTRSRQVKLDFPRFSSGDPTTWITAVERYFAFYLVPIPDRLNLAAFHLDEPATSWFYGADQNGLMPDWRTFCTALLRRFGPSEFEDPAGTLEKIQQTGSVLDYQSSFEKLVSKVPSLSATLLRSIFISGLKPHIWRSVLTLRPIDYHEAFSLARVFEDQSNKHRPTRSWTTASKTPNPPLLSNTTTTNPIPAIPIRRLSQVEMQQKREKNLCYNCDEIFSFGHKCKGRPALLYLEGEEEDPDPGPMNETDENQTNEVTPEIRFNALFGHQSSRSFRLTGAIRGKNVQILVDGGSTHNFITSRMALFLSLTMHHINPFQVQVGNSDTLHCTASCIGVPLNLQAQMFTVDLFVLDLKGDDLVLRIQWLETLGPILTDYAQMSMSFSHNNSTTILQGDRTITPTQISQAQFHKLIAQDSVSSYFICLTSTGHDPTPHQRQLLLPPTVHQMLTQFHDLFDIPQSLPPDHNTNHHINLFPNSKPVQVRPYRYHYFQKMEIKRMVSEMLTTGVIRPSQSPFSSPVLLVRKKDGTWRFCVDYRVLNGITVPDKFPIPIVDELLDKLHGAQIFSKLDLRSGYHQIRMNPDDVHKITFRTHSGHFEFLVMPFGLSNAPSTFQATMNHVFSKYLRRFVAIFFVDILVYSPSLQAHVDHLRQVLLTLRHHQFFIKQSKCSFAVKEIQFLGHIISASGVSPDPSKVMAIREWPIPQYVTQLRAFLGLFGYYRRFIKGYASVAAPLTDLLSKDAFEGTSHIEQGFNTLKDLLTNAPILALPNFIIPFTLETDASGVGIGAMLLQLDHPIAIFSRKLSKLMQAKSIHYREMYAITTAVAKWRQYLLGSPFVIRTDHRSLHHLMSQVIQTLEQQQFLAKLLGFNYSIQYKPGKLNTAEDALSHQPELLPTTGNDPTLMALSIPTSTYSSTIQSEIQKDAYANKILQELQTNPTKWPHWSSRNGGFTDILVVVEKLTKGAHFMALPPKHSATKVAQGTALHFSSAYHPKSDGQTERVNQSLEQYLRCFVHNNQLTWHRFLSWAEFHYNTAYNRSTQTTPFQATYGRSLPCLLAYTLGPTSLEAVDTGLHQRTMALASLKQNLKKAQALMKAQADRKRKDHTFQTGDQVLLRLQPYRQFTVHRRSSHKLSLQFYGPLEVLERIEKVAYRLKLPEGSRVHPIFHVSLLRPFHHKIHLVTADPRSTPPMHVPATVVAQRVIWRQGREIPQVLIQWQGLPSKESTWEDEKLVFGKGVSKIQPLPFPFDGKSKEVAEETTAKGNVLGHPTEMGFEDSINLASVPANQSEAAEGPRASPISQESLATSWLPPT
ncbi:uncharacterized protein LOC133302076 [Gastrolobium bilobum]|uniref:uncharacterized protein LOC133302076 n=1 Tax=Gastrolobium bilobum TaxID=150636 RepID=UPI002AAF8594|nr:uncharacterized protein LOC133302076 [Gastrolobium bilobum]